MVPSAHAYVDVLRKGDLSSLSWIQSKPIRTQPSQSGQKIVCSVTYASLNFWDIMLASGKLVQEAIPNALELMASSLLGMEFSGRDSHGNKVMGIAASKVI